MKDRKTVLFFLIPLFIFALGAAGNLIYEKFSVDTTTASIQTRDLSGVATPEALREDLNQMTLKDLCRLPGIGEVTAQRILDYRQAHGGFRSVEELAKIKGIGEKTLAKLKELVYVED